MRKYGTAVLGLMFALSLGGCGEGERTVYVAKETSVEQETSAAQETSVNQETGLTAAESGETSQEVQEIPELAVRREENVPPENMTLYSSCSFSFDNEEWQLCLYIQAELVIDGSLALDDRCAFLIRAEKGDGAYTLFEDIVQLGVPAGDVWMDLENRIHIAIRDVRSARYQVTEYVYDGEADAFYGQRVVDQDGVNYIGSVGE